MSSLYEIKYVYIVQLNVVIFNIDILNAMYMSKRDGSPNYIFLLYFNVNILGFIRQVLDNEIYPGRYLQLAQ